MKNRCSFILGLGCFVLLLLESCTLEPDDIPPAAPTGVGTRNGSNHIEIYWDANAESDLDGYNVHWSSTEFGNYQLVAEHLGKNQTYFRDSQIDSNQSYYYKVTAFDDSDNESNFSRPALGYLVSGVTSISRDGQVTLLWDEPKEGVTISLFKISRGRSIADLDSIGIVDVNYNSYEDEQVSNGTTYVYAISAFDHRWNESGISFDVAYDTPRPEGYDLTLNYNHEDSINSLNGINFSRYLYGSSGMVTYAAQDPETDIYYMYVLNAETHKTHYFYCYDIGTKIKYFDEPTSSLQDVDNGLEGSWDIDGIIEVTDSLNSYIVLTKDNHYAHIRITSIAESSLTLDWAYQMQAGNPQLKPIPPGGTNQ